MARARVLFFAGARDAAGCESAEVAWEGGSLAVADFWARLVESFPSLAPLRDNVRVARNFEYLDRTGEVGDGDEVALIPPVSGG